MVENELDELHKAALKAVGGLQDIGRQLPKVEPVFPAHLVELREWLDIVAQDAVHLRDRLSVAVHKQMEHKDKLDRCMDLNVSRLAGFSERLALILGDEKRVPAEAREAPQSDSLLSDESASFVAEIEASMAKRKFPGSPFATPVPKTAKE